MQVPTIAPARHPKPIHQHNDIHLADVIIPCRTPALGSLVNNQFAGVIEHSPFELRLICSLDLNQKLGAIIARTGQIKDHGADSTAIPDILVFIIDQILDYFTTLEYSIKQVNQ